ncbi:MAG: multidrug RND transporter, partial [Micrococcales bacterium]
QAMALVFPPVEPGYDPYAISRPHVEQIARQAGSEEVPVRALDYGLLAEGSSEGADRGLLAEVAIGTIGALVVLLLVFSSVLALAPLMVAAVSILATFAALLALTYLTDISYIVQFLVALIGLGVAIDYSLLLAMRWREELANGYPNEQAIERSMRAAGHSVLISGLTVAVSLAVLIAIPVPFLRSIGLGAMLIPLLSVAVALTMLPAVLSFGGPRLLWPRQSATSPHSRLWSSIARATLRRRWLSAAAATAILLALAWPATGLRLGSPPATTVATGSDAQLISAAAQAGLPLGAFRPIEVLVPQAQATEVAQRLDAGLAGAQVLPMDRHDPAGLSRLLVLTGQDPTTEAGRGILDALRAEPGLQVGGTPALDADFVTATYRDGAWALVIVAVATFWLLARGLRSLWLPVKALVLNVLSIAAAYGITALIWQRGYGAEAVFDVTSTGVVATWVPITALAFLFGLSMDYEVFILARMRESYDEQGDTDTAVVEGIADTGRLVSSGAAILVFAFVALATVPTVEVKILATTLALGIAIDAVIVRGVLAPALVGLFGSLNWILPQW